MTLRVGDLLAVPVENGRIGLAQILALEPQIWVAVVRYEAAAPPLDADLKKLVVAEDPVGLTGAVHGQVSDEAPCPFEVVGNIAPVTERRFPRAHAWDWARLPAEVYFGGNSGLDLQGDDVVVTQLVRDQDRQDARKVLDKIYRSQGSSRGKARSKGRALPKAHQALPARLELLDEDSVLIFASADALVRRYSDQPYDYDFPAALLEGMNAAELGAVAHEYSELRVDVELGAKHDHARARMCGRVKIGKADQLLAIPHSPFTRACDTYEGRADKLDDEEYVRLELAPGTYDLSVLRVRGGHFSVRLVQVAGEAKATPAPMFGEIERV